MDVSLGKILPINIESEMKNSYIDYAMSVIVSRALPDVRDGMKPVHRRILYAMHEAGMLSNKPHKKSARIVGEVLGKYHPHGDSSVYDAAVRLAQDFSTRYQLVDGHGNFGSVDGDSAAAMRYTEVRMSKIAEEMLSDIEKNTVDFAPNYDESLEEPTVLPSKIPNLLANGSSGIAVGMATNIPPHNLGEVIDALLLMIDDENVETALLLEAIKGPDFPTGALILGREGFTQAYMTGRGTVKVRAKTHIEPHNGGREKIVVTELPYQVNKARLIENIASLVRDKVLEGLSDLRDESDRKGMRIVIELKRDTNADIVLNHLYKHTQLQDSFGIILLALVENRPRILTLREMLFYYLEHQKTVIVRRTQFELKKAQDRAHILEGLKIALDNLDAVIKTIRAAKTPGIAKEELIAGFSLSEKQAQAILDMRLQRLTGLERDKIIQEYKDVLEQIAYLESILADGNLVLQIIRSELLDIKKRFADKRRTQIVAMPPKTETLDLIPVEDVIITITKQGYIKRQRTALETFHTQKRGGKGITAMNTKEDDDVYDIFIATTHHHILFFTNNGRVFRLRAHEIPEASRTARGNAIINLIPLEKSESVTATIAVADFSPETYLFMATKNGIIKKTSLHDFANLRKNGLIAIKLDDDDILFDVKQTNGNNNIFMATKNGYCIQFSEQSVRTTGRNTRGVRGIKLNKNDSVIGIEIVQESSDILTITAKGFGKRTSSAAYRLQTRGGKGLINYKITKKSGTVAGIKVITEDCDIMLITNEGVVIRTNTDAITSKGRATKGVKAMRLEEPNQIIGITLVKEKL